MKTVTMRNILLISFCIILFVLQDWLQQHLEVFQYIDELFALLIVPMAAGSSRRSLRSAGQGKESCLLYF